MGGDGAVSLVAAGRHNGVVMGFLPMAIICMWRFLRPRTSWFAGLDSMS